METKRTSNFSFTSNINPKWRCENKENRIYHATVPGENTAVNGRMFRDYMHFRLDGSQQRGWYRVYACGPLDLGWEHIDSGTPVKGLRAAKLIVKQWLVG